jgi:hypothetical protein
MPNMRAKRTGTLWIISALAVGLVAGCGKEPGGGGSGGSSNVDRTGGSGGSRSGTGGASSGSGGSSSAGGSSGGSAGGGVGSTGGSGVTPGTGGSGAGGAGGSGSSGDAGPDQNFNPPADKAVAKFCNGLVGENMMILEFGLEIGMQPVRLVAKSGECFPALNQPCTTIPVGPVTLKIVDMSDQSLLAMADTTIMGGSQMLFFTDIDMMTMQPFLGGQRLRADVNCALIAGEPPGPPADGGAQPPRPPIRP